MPDLPKTLFNLGADWLTTITRQHLRRGTNFASKHGDVLQTLLPSLAPTVHGNALDLRSNMTESEFLADVPLSNHDTYASLVERMRAGEPDVLWAGKCELFASTAGTTTGRPRIVPVTPPMIEHFYRMTRYAALNASARAGNIDALRGRALLLGGHTCPPAPLPRDSPLPAFPTTADLSTLAALYKTSWIARHFFEPTAKIALESDWAAMVDRILHRTQNREISLIAGQPQWLIAFGQQVLDSLAESMRRHTSLHAAWPKLRCVIHTGSSCQTSRQALQRIAGPKVLLHEIYAAAEGIFAIQGHHPSPGLRLITDSGIYFEFLPVEDYDPTNLSRMASRTVPLAAVDMKTDYIMIVTTPAGLVRHIVGDVVRFTRLRPHYLYPVGQIELRLSTFGENLLARDATNALFNTCEVNRWQISNFHVAPLLDSNALGVHRGRHEWWVELKSGSQVTPTGPVLSSQIDLMLKQEKPRYAERRQSGQIGEPLVRLVMPGAFEHWIRHSGQWGGPHKLPEVRNDREIADGLNQMVRFWDH
jgi:hypothetical protein